MKRHRPYLLQEYNPQWNEQFLSEAKKLEPAFGDNLVEIQHIGSTAIKDMVAKPQIDILIVVKNLDEVKDLHGTFSNLGYTVHGRGHVAPDDEYVSLDAPDGARLVSIHILQEGNPKISDYKNFRDYLNENKSDRELYIATKRRLCSLHSKNYAGYDDGKKDVITAIKGRAREWSAKQN